MKISTLTMSVANVLANGYSIPRYQRDEVWPAMKKQLLIDTIMRNWLVPPLVTAGKNADDLMDGQQRTSTVAAYVNDGFRTSMESNTIKLTIDGKNFSDLGGKLFSELPEPVQKHIMDYEFTVTEITEATPQEINEMFRRQNSGVSLNAAEMRRATAGTISGAIRNLVKKSPLFKSGLVSVTNTRSGLETLVAQMLLLDSYYNRRCYIRGLKNDEHAYIEGSVIITDEGEEDISGMYHSALTSKQKGHASAQLLESREARINSSAINSFYSVNKGMNSKSPEIENAAKILEFIYKALVSVKEENRQKIKKVTLVTMFDSINKQYHDGTLKLTEANAKKEGAFITQFLADVEASKTTSHTDYWELTQSSTDSPDSVQGRSGIVMKARERAYVNG